MKNKNDDAPSGIEYGRWKRVIWVTQLSLAGMIFLTEVVSNTMLYVTRSQGYGPDTIVQKLLRYLVLTTLINFGIIFVAKILVRHTENIKLQAYIMIISTELMLFDVVYSHYQFADCLGIFILPIILSIFFEDARLCSWAFGIGLIGLGIGVVARGSDPGYNTDIGPEAAIAFCFTLSVYLLSRICLKVLSDRRQKLNEALEEAEKVRFAKQMEEVSVQVLETLAQTIDTKDRYTTGHSYRVAEYSVRLAQALGMDPEEVRVLRQEALLHDIGKIGVLDSVLNKRGKLTDIEYKVMKSHTTAGAEILQNLITFPGAAAVAGGHHERYDGRGYPLQLRGEENPPHARIVSIADAYDAMSSDRIYRKALDHDKIRQELVNGRGTQFDPQYLDVFLKLFDEDALQVPPQKDDELVSDRFPMEGIREDLKAILRDMAVRDDHGGAFRVENYDFPRMYEYLKALEARHKYTFELVEITTKPIEGESITQDELEEAIDSMETAIRKNIRAVDIYTRYSEVQHIVVLVNADPSKVDMIIQRIFLDYYKLSETKKFALSYESGNTTGEWA